MLCTAHEGGESSLLKKHHHAKRPHQKILASHRTQTEANLMSQIHHEFSVKRERELICRRAETLRLRTNSGHIIHTRELHLRWEPINLPVAVMIDIDVIRPKV